MQTKGRLVTGRHARTYDWRGPMWNLIKVKHLGMVNPLPGQRVLDVGCGTGKTLAMLSEKCDISVELHGIEASDDMLREARAKRYSRRIRIEKGFAQKLPHPDDYFDFVISAQVMHHLPPAEKKKMLREMRRVLKPGCTIVLSDWGQPTTLPGKLVGFLWRNHAYVAENSSVLTKDSLRNNGFKNVKEELQFGVMHHIRGLKV